MNETFRSGILGRVTDRGLGYILDTESGVTLAFTFDKFQDYKGQSIKELGLKPGRNLSFLLDKEGAISKVIL